MANGYYRPNAGVQTGSAFMSGIMRSYNRSLFMKADILRYRNSMNLQKQQMAMQQDRLDIAEESADISKFKTSVEFHRLDRASGLTNDLAPTSYGADFDKQFRGIGTKYTSDNVAAGLSGDYPPSGSGGDFVGPRLEGVGTQRIAPYQSEMYRQEKGMVPSYYHRASDTHWARDPLSPGKPGKQLFAHREFDVEEQDRTIANIRETATEGTKPLAGIIDKMTKESVDNPEKRDRIVKDILVKTADNIGEVYDGSTEGWNKLGNETQQIIINKTIDSIFNADTGWFGRSPGDLAKFASTLANITNADVSEQLIKKFVDITVKPSLFSRITALVMPGGPKYTTGQLQSYTKEATDVVVDAIYAGGPNVIMGFLGKALSASGEPLDPSSPEAETIIRAMITDYMSVKVRQEIDRHTFDREVEGGIPTDSSADYPPRQSFTIHRPNTIPKGRPQDTVTPQVDYPARQSFVGGF